MEAELRAVYRVGALDLKTVPIALPTVEESEGYVSAAQRRLRGMTAWFCVQYRVRPCRPAFPEALRTYVPHAEKLVRSLFYRAEVFDYQGCDSLFGVGIRTLELTRRRPGSSIADSHNIEHTLPPIVADRLRFGRTTGDYGERKVSTMGGGADPQKESVGLAFTLGGW